jgi:predicted DCC family thiol-disulfide oxidoreductase YuxK
MQPEPSLSVIYFDGICNLCNRMVQWIIKHDKNKRFLFAALQSKAGQELQHQYGGTLPDSIILSYQNKLFVKSDAVLKIASLIGGGFALLTIFYIVPRFLRDRVYDLIARKRYSWYGKRSSCMVPTPELQSRFLE